MKANELRIGNWVNTPNKNQNPFRVDYFDELKVYMKTGTYNAGAFGDIPFHPLTWDISQLSPIPITPEVLEGCEEFRLFEKIGERKIYVHKKFWRIKVEISTSYLCLYLDDNLINYKKYLHEFQNLMYSLTDEELTYTP